MNEFVYVLKNPSEDMVCDGRDAFNDTQDIAYAYQMMLRAAPTQPAAKVIAYRVLQSETGNPLTDWIDGAPDGEPALSSSKYQLAYAQPSPAESDKEAVRNAALEEAANACAKHISPKPETMGIEAEAAYASCCNSILALKIQPSQPVENESEIILNWLIRHMSASELQRIGIPCPPGCTIDDIKQSMKQWKPGDKPAAAQPSDTEMLDWLIEKEYAVRLMGGGYDLFDTDSGEWLDVDRPAAREAIKAAMQADRERS